MPVWNQRRESRCSDMSPAKRNRLLLWAALACWSAVMIWAARKVLLPYIVGLVLAYLLLPLVNWLDRHMPARLHNWRFARPLSILLTYLLLFALVAGIVAFFVPIVVDQVQVLIENWPSLASRVEDWGDAGLGLVHREHPRTTGGYHRDQLEKPRRLMTYPTPSETAWSPPSRTVFSTISYVIGLVVIPFWLFYILHDESQVKAGVLQRPAPATSGRCALPGQPASTTC